MFVAAAAVYCVVYVATIVILQSGDSIRYK